MVCFQSILCGDASTNRLPGISPAGYVSHTGYQYDSISRVAGHRELAPPSKFSKLGGFNNKVFITSGIHHPQFLALLELNSLASVVYQLLPSRPAEHELPHHSSVPDLSGSPNHKSRVVAHAYTMLATRQSLWLSRTGCIEIRRLNRNVRGVSVPRWARPTPNVPASSRRIANNSRFPPGPHLKTRCRSRNGLAVQLPRDANHVSPPHQKSCGTEPRPYLCPLRLARKPQCLILVRKPAQNVRLG